MVIYCFSTNVAVERIDTTSVAKPIEAWRWIVKVVEVHEADDPVAGVDNELNWVDEIAEIDNGLDQFDGFAEIVDRVDIHTVIGFNNGIHWL